MTPETHDAPRKCSRCGDELPGGIRFCVACGTNNFDPDAGRLAQAECQITMHARRRWHEKFIYWYRWMSGIRW
ncbi:hypothetical protein Pla175_32480 [Pirellulimonas nuda]|uniref:Zinc-ribbon domain-containing protein n=1 Tax=Pirellulimonas nuda TaxID=2528009 RepID=A0A518DEJ1_9BACT|nr:hypothetical protein [Pirellulimonas nuda]QDU89852.1 hypothetical protein Pla175_32480 [Pirellulimonas nuda]